MNHSRISLNLKRLTFTALLIALAFVLPFLTGQIPQIGSMLSPMHLPILLCGFICGWQYGLAAGFIAPLLRSLTLGMPPLLPTALAMAFELAAYGAFSGLFYKLLPKKLPYTYISLIASMLIGRIVWGAAMLIIAGIRQTAFGIEAFWVGAFANAAPAIILQLVLIPLLVMALRKAKLCLNG